MLPIEVDPQSEIAREMFQWAPTLGGECYKLRVGYWAAGTMSFNGHPPLGVNATMTIQQLVKHLKVQRFNGHPPLGVNATLEEKANNTGAVRPFQWAPTLGGECYGIVYLITPPLCQGVNALLNISPRF